MMLAQNSPFEQRHHREASRRRPMEPSIGRGTQAATLGEARADYRGPLAIVTTLFFMWGSLPSAKVIDWLGYKKAIVAGLLTMVVACLGFYPAATIPSFPFFLAALIVLATGITILQVAAHPYVAVLGAPRTASSRLNLTQAFNSLGTAVFPWVGARVILGTTSAAIAQSTSQEATAIIRLYVYFF